MLERIVEFKDSDVRVVECMYFECMTDERLVSQSNGNDDDDYDDYDKYNDYDDCE